MRFEDVLTSWSIQKKLRMLLLLILLPSCGIVIWTGVDHRVRAVRDAAANAMLLVQSLAAQQEQFAAGTEQMLTTLAHMTEVQKLDAAGCSRLFRESNNRHPFYSVISAVTPDGNIFAASLPVEGNVNLSDRKYVKDALNTLRFSAGEFSVGRLSRLQSLSYSYPVLDAGNNPIAIVIAGFRLDVYSLFAAKANLPEGSTVEIADWAGVRLIDWPDDDLLSVGTPVAANLFRCISGDLEQGTFERTGEDGVFRVYAFKQLRLSEREAPYLYVLVGVPRNAVLLGANLDLFRNLTILGLAALLAVCLSWGFGNLAFLRPINHLVAATERFGQGEMGARTGLPHTPDELGRLAASFDGMAALLEERDMESRSAEQALRDSEARLRAITDSARDAILMLDTMGVISYWNPAAEQILGYAKEEALGRNLHDLIAPRRYCAQFQAAFSMFQETGTGNSVGRTIELEARRKDDEKIPVELSLSAVFMNGWHAVGVLRDITERKRAETRLRKSEERLQRAEKMEALGTLAGGVAHDLNNVLGIVVGYAELLLEDLGDSGPTRSEAMEILKGGQRAAAIVQDLLTLARRGVSSRKVLNLNDIVRECCQSPGFARVLAGHPDIEVVTDLEEDLLNISASPVHLEKSFLNLVSNAVEAMPNGGTLKIESANLYLDRPVVGYDEVREGDYVVLTVSDTGEGIPASDLKRIFEPFFTKKVMGRSGTGLGLAVVWGTVKDHLGYVHVESEEGRGTAFYLYFPVTREEMSLEPIPVSHAECMGQGETILVVDDVREQRELAGTMLGKLNYTVSVVASGEEAVEFLRKRRVDLVVLDMIMEPGMDGLDTYRKIVEIHPRQKAIVVSGFSETERVAEAQALGAGAYVKKPYVMGKLGQAVRNELRRPG
ncbi:MAG: PAS domain S-box protein [Syntrophobacteraceae bacterium]